MVLTFLERWSAVEEPLTFLREDRWWPMSLRIDKLASSDPGLAIAAGLIALIPAVLVFRWGQPYLELGIGGGGT